MGKSNDNSSSASSCVSKQTTPRATIHKQILDVAESRPEASIEAIADNVAGGTPNLVEKVLEEYGDPGEAATDQQGTAGATPQPATPTSDTKQLEAMPDSHDTRDPEDETDDQTDATGASESADAAADSGSTDAAEGSEPTVPDPETLTETQLETLQAVHSRPTATQAELASEFDITAASVGQRVNAIDGFDWSERRAFTEALFDSPAGTAGSTTAEDESEATTSTVEAESETATSTIETESETNTSMATAVNGTAPSRAEADGGTARSTGRSEPGMDESATDGGADDDVTAREYPEEVKALAARIDRLDQRLAEQSPAAAGGPLEPDLVHKVTHACMRSDRISEDEELRILRSLMGAGES